jgi:hypothetical protein
MVCKLEEHRLTATNTYQLPARQQLQLCCCQPIVATCLQILQMNGWLRLAPYSFLITPAFLTFKEPSTNRASTHFIQLPPNSNTNLEHISFTTFCTELVSEVMNCAILGAKRFF